MNLIKKVFILALVLIFNLGLKAQTLVNLMILGIPIR